MSIQVLIADDHAVFRSGLRALLEKEEDIIVVGETGDGPATLDALELHPVDVLILDITMPGKNGTEVAAAAIRRRPKLSIVVLTMHEDEYYLQEMLRVGARAFVLKKSTGTELVEAIRSAHSGQQYVDSALAGSVISTLLGRRRRGGGQSRADLLTPREREICTLLANGHTNAEISAKLAISERTVETHRSHIMGKLSLQSRAELVRFAIEHGLMRLN